MGQKMSDILEQLAGEHGLQAHVGTLRRYVLPCVGFDVLPEATSDSLGESRLGGSPDVPNGFVLPTAKGKPLDFLLQLKLDELPRHGLSERLPATGLLSFFYDLNEQPWGYDPKELDGFRVFHFPERATLERVEIGSEFAMSPSALRFWRAWSLPSYGSRVGDRLLEELRSAPHKDEEFDQLHELSHALFRSAAPNPDGPSHRIGGHSDNVQGDMQLEAQLVMNGLYCGDASGYNDPRRAKLESTCEEWQLLLQLDSDDDAGFMWGDCGMLYFWLRDQDLANGDFSRTWMSLQCC
jgi:uncharacterized protein YwqG